MRHDNETDVLSCQANPDAVGMSLTQPCEITCVITYLIVMDVSESSGGFQGFLIHSLQLLHLQAGGDKTTKTN